jgi:hypothetical protein
VQGSEGAGAGQPPGADPKPKASHTANSLGSPAAQAKREARKRNAYERRRYGGPSAQSAPFAKYSGPSSEGQLHLAEFGSEAEAAQRAEAAAAVTVYLAAAGAERWGEACGYLSAEARAQLQAMPGGDDESCAEQLPAVIDFLRQPGQAEAVMAPQGIASLRIETGGRFGEGVGFVLFHGNDGGDYWLAMRREGGQWRLLSVIPQPFTG